MLALTLFLILIATANLCLGFALAVYCQVGPQRWPWEEKADPTGDDHLPLQLDDANVQAEVGAPPLPAVKEVPAPIAAGSPPSHAVPEPEIIDTSSASATIASPYFAPLRPLVRGIEKLDTELAEWEARQRESEQNAESFANAVVELGGLGVGYAQQFQTSVAALAPWASITEAAQDALAEMNMGLLDFEQQVQAIAAEGTLPTAELAEVLRRVHETIYTARNRLEEPLAKLALEYFSTGDELAELVPHATEPLLGRLALEHAWREDEAGVVVMFDVDHLGETNAKVGTEVSQAMLLALGKVLRGALPQDATLVRIHGQQFVLFLVGSSLDRAAEIAERLRQQVERTTFQSCFGDLQVTVSAAVIERQARESARDGLSRLRSTIREVKSYGRNRTFLLEDDIPTPVMPPKLSLPSSTVALPSLNGKP